MMRVVRRLGVWNTVVLLGCGGAASATPASAPEPVAAAPSTADTTVTAPSVQRVPFVSASAGRGFRVAWRIPRRDGQLPRPILEGIAPHIAQLRAEPDSFALDVSGALPLAELLRVYAEHANGEVLGEIRDYGYSLYEGLSIDSLGLIRASRPGIGLFLVSLPDSLAAKMPARGPLRVRIFVSDSTGRLPAAPSVPRGSAAVSGTVTDSAGRPIARASARVLLRTPTGPQSIDITETDIEGRFRLERLPAGEYTLIVAQGGRQPVVEQLQLRDGSAEHRDLKLGPARPRSSP